jgi:hypothetical protein
LNFAERYAVFAVCLFLAQIYFLIQKLNRLFVASKAKFFLLLQFKGFMKIRIKKFIALFLICLIGLTGIGSTYFFESGIENRRQEAQIISYSDLIPQFDQGLEFSSTNINVPGFKVLETVFDLFNEPYDNFFTLSGYNGLKVNWFESCHRFFSIRILLYPFHYFW